MTRAGAGTQPDVETNPPIGMPATGRPTTGPQAQVPPNEATDNSPAEGHPQRQQGDEDLDEDSKSRQDSQGMK